MFPLKIYPTPCRYLARRVVSGERIQVVLLILLALTSGVAILLGLMVVGLMEAPWPILLLLLVVGLFGLQRLAARVTEGDASVVAFSAPTSAPKSTIPKIPLKSPSKAPSTPSEAPADDRPTFTYRGIKYHPSALSKPVTDEHPTVTEGIYRGQRWQRASTDAAKSTPSSQPSMEIKYRGHRVKPNPEPDESKDT